LIKNKRVMVVLPAYNAAQTLERTVAETPREIVDDVLVDDDVSKDTTAILSAKAKTWGRPSDYNRCDVDLGGCCAPRTMVRFGRDPCRK
jgi:hypothetical protein